MFKITSSNGDPLKLSDGYRHPRPGFDPNARHWDYSVLSESNAEFEGRFSAGSLVRYADDNELRNAVMRSIAADAESVTDYGASVPTTRDLIVQLVEEYGEDDPVAAYDTAEVLQELSEWYWALTHEERDELRRYADNGED